MTAPIVALDACCLVRLSPAAKTNLLDRARLEHLLEEVASARGKIVIPAPAFAEFLVGIDEAAADWLEALERKRHVEVVPFDKRCAFEASLLDKAALNRGDKRGGRQEPWQKIKIDRQIVAVARRAQASLLVSDDSGLRLTATAAGLQVMSIGDLELPDSARQHVIEFPGNTRPDPLLSIGDE